MTRILLTNDDGVDAPGLRALHESLVHALDRSDSASSIEILTVAPDRCRSECSHSIEAKRPLQIRQVDPNWHSVDGTPVDCVRVATFAMGFEPDLVLSGINAGANLGVNLMVSGTFAAAREANTLGFPAMAISHYRHPDVPKTWDHTATWLEETINEFVGEAINKRPRHHQPLWNVNLPAIDPTLDRIPKRIVCKVDTKPLQRSGSVTPDGKVHFELDFHGRPREPDRDVACCFGGNLTISKLNAHWID